MAINTVEDLFTALVRSRTAAELRKLLADIGDHPDVELNEAFGPLGLQWHEFGDRMSNISTIGLGTKPGRSLTERLTNGMDAILEARAAPGVALPTSSRAAAKQWFGRPVTGPEDGLFRWNYAEGDYDRQVQVLLLGSGIENSPTVDVIDRGIGIRPLDFPRTILSLQEGNKLTKLHLIGAFGQGGAATLAFADYAFIASRHKDAPETVGFTLIRVIRLSDLYKEDAYAYLTVRANGGALVVPSVQLNEPVKLYEADGLKNLPSLQQGTVVRHVGYKLPGISGALSPSEGNLYHYLHTSMFDPLFPFRVIDLRDASKARDELVTGNRNRLMRLVQKKEEGSEGRIEIRHHRPMEYVTPYGASEISIGIEYWVVYAFRKAPKGKGREQILRPASNEVFAQRSHPIIGTLNGQNQGELTAKLLKDIGLGMVARHIVIHIDASLASSRVRRELFSTNREGFKDGDVLKDLTRVLQGMLEEDEELQKIERELTDRLTKRETEQANKEVIEQITKLLLDAGMKVSKEGAVPGQGEGEKQRIKEKKRQPYKKGDPLPTLPFPEVTQFKIVSPLPQMRVPLNDHEIVLVETDADAEFDKQGRVAVRWEPPEALEQVGKAPLRGGRIRWRLRPVADTKIGMSGKVIVTVTRPNGTQLQDEVSFEVLPPRQEKSKKDQGLVPPFTVDPVSPDDVELWGDLWPDLGEEASPEDQASVAYKSMKGAGHIKVYYSTIFEPYRATVDGLKRESPALAPLFETSYAVWVGYHAILQENSKAEMPEGIDDDAAELLLELDRTRVAKMQVKQAMQTAQLRHQLMKSKAEVE